jgi:type IV pilus assembly protein PilW
MVSITIGLFLMAGVIQTFLMSKANYTAQNEVARAQEGGRFAVEFLNFDARMAGYIGTPNLYRVTPNLVADSLPAYVTNALTNGQTVAGYESTGTDHEPVLPTITKASGTGGVPPASNSTDALTILRVSECGAYLSSQMALNAAGPITVIANACGFAANDLLMVSDCQSADVLRASAGTGSTSIVLTGANTPANLGKPYSTDAQVYRFIPTTYYITTGADGRSALWRHTEGRDPEELAAGVEDLQILYGEDTDADQAANRYVKANEANMGQVVSMRITLTAATEADGVTLAANTAGGDRRLRRTFTTTVNLRNRSLSYP